MLKQNGIPRWEVTTTSTNHTTSWKLQIKLFLSNYVTKNLADFFRCAFIELWVHQGSLRKQKSHRRTGNFLPGGAVNQKLPKFLRKSRKEMRAILQQHRPSWHMKVAIQFFRVNTKSEHKLRRHKQTFGKIATSVVLRLKFVIIRVAMTLELP